MHCKACDKALSDFECTRKIVNNDGMAEYPDLCNNCFKASGLRSMVVVVERQDLPTDVDVYDEVGVFEFLSGEEF